MDLYLVRHAAAAERDPVGWPDDAQRPLTVEGRARFREAARGLRSLVPQVDVVLSSPYVRAWETALVLQKEAGWPAPEACQALASPHEAAVLDAVAAYARADSVALVGHEPHLSGLATSLLRSRSAYGAIEMKKGAVAYLEIGEPRAGTAAVLRWLLPPRVLRRLA